LTGYETSPFWCFLFNLLAVLRADSFCATQPSYAVIHQMVAWYVDARGADLQTSLQSGRRKPERSRNLTVSPWSPFINLTIWGAPLNQIMIQSIFTRRFMLKSKSSAAATVTKPAVSDQGEFATQYRC
jgi:hypothetical protein